MTITAEARTAMASILDANSDLEVAVVIRGTSGTGLSLREDSTTDFTATGELGVTNGRVRVSSAAFSRPNNGETILVDGNECIVTNVAGMALWVIEYSRVRKVSGV